MWKILLPSILCNHQVRATKAGILKCQGRILFSGLMAAKRLVATCWKPHLSLDTGLSLLHILYLELPPGDVNRVTEEAINALSTAVVSNLL